MQYVRATYIRKRQPATLCTCNGACLSQGVITFRPHNSALPAASPIDTQPRPPDVTFRRDRYALALGSVTLRDRIDFIANHGSVPCDVGNQSPPALVGTHAQAQQTQRVCVSHIHARMALAARLPCAKRLGKIRGLQLRPTPAGQAAGCNHFHAATTTRQEVALDDTVADNLPPLEDKFGRKHTYLRISLTERCNLRCTGAQFFPPLILSNPGLACSP